MNFKHLMKYVSLLIVGLLAGNSFAFVLGVGSAIEKLSASSYIAFHESMQRSFLSWTPLLCGFLVLILGSLLVALRKEWREFEFFFVLFALLCILDELVMSWNGNFPLNRIINAWRVEGAPSDWSYVRTQWLHFMYWRCALMISSFILLLASVFLTKTDSRLSPNVAAVF